jgi:hypothetical protein
LFLEVTGSPCLKNATVKQIQGSNPMIPDLFAAFSHLSTDQLVALVAIAAFGVVALALRVVWLALKGR